MKLSVAAWSFAYCTTQEAINVAASLGFTHVDLGINNFKPQLDRARIVTDGAAYGREFARACRLRIANIYALFGCDRYDRNLSDPRHHERNFADFREIMQFCKATSTPSVFVLPGIVNAGQSRADAIAVSVDALKRLVDIGREAGVEVQIEAHSGSLIEAPGDCIEFLQRVPGLKLALDPSHFTMQGVPQAEVHRLVGYAGHVHLRQAAPGQAQRKLEDGTINFPALFGALRDAGYQGCLATEYIHAPAMAAYVVDVLSETIKMRDSFLSWQGATR
ncbi:MAG: sugar phosphate isomerase/epimerase [Alphaproteobacteria bacterium]|nr:sugar phosphate isomerase/epimerase [Alphaproteobacteria bacterium]